MFAHFVQANDANQLEDVLKRHAGSIACLLIEPIMGNCLGIAADPAYIRAARELCDRHGVVLIIDEVKSGFRVARGGVQELYSVQADLCTFAKAIANGYPISVLAGREDIMRKIGRGVAHGVPTLRIRSRWRRRRRRCRYLMKPMRSSASRPTAPGCEPA